MSKHHISPYFHGYRSGRRSFALAFCAAIAALSVGVGAHADPAPSDGFYLVADGSNEDRAIELPDRHGGAEWLVAPPLMSFAEVAQAETILSDDGRVIVLVRLTAAGAGHFGSLTTRHVGERFAVVVSGAVVVAPMIVEPISGGQFQIDGGFTWLEAQDMAARIAAHIPN